MSISSNVEIMTREELQGREDRAFQRGVARGRFEQNHDNSKSNTPETGQHRLARQAAPSRDGERPGDEPVAVGPQAAGRFILDGWEPLAKALFAVEHDQRVMDQAWFDFQGKAQRILANIQQQQS